MTTLPLGPCAARVVADRIGRRDFVALAGGLTASWTTPARAQATPVIGYLGSESPQRYASRLSAFREGLAQTGYVEGRNVSIEFRWAEGHYGQLPALARDLAGRQVAVMVAPGGAEVALAAKSATTTIPIVFEMGGDSVAPRGRERPSRAGGHPHRVAS